MYLILYCSGFWFWFLFSLYLQFVCTFYSKYLHVHLPPPQILDAELRIFMWLFCLALFLGHTQTEIDERAGKPSSRSVSEMFLSQTICSHAHSSWVYSDLWVISPVFLWSLKSNENTKTFVTCFTTGLTFTIHMFLVIFTALQTWAFVSLDIYVTLTFTAAPVNRLPLIPSAKRC